MPLSVLKYNLKNFFRIFVLFSSCFCEVMDIEEGGMHYMKNQREPCMVKKRNGRGKENG